MAPLTPNDALRLAKQALAQAQEQRRANESFMRSIGPAIVDALSPMLKQLSDKIGTLKVDVKPNVTVNPEIRIPKIEVPEAHVTFEVPEITVPAPQVTVNVPEIKVPSVVMPKEMDIKGFISLMGYDKGLLNNPLPVQIRDHKGNPIDFSQLGGGAVVMGGQGGGGFKFVTVDGIMASAFGDLMNPDGRLRVAVDVAGSGSGGGSSVSLVNSDGAYYNSDNPLPVTFTASGAPQPVSQVSGAAWSVSVTDIFGSTAANVVNPDGRLKVSVDASSSGLGSVFATPATPDGIPYNGDNPQPVTIPSTLRIDQLSGAVFSVNNIGPVAQGDEATALRVVVAGNSAVSVTATQAGTFETRQVSGAADSVVVNSGTLDGITNTVRVDQVSGAVFSVNNVGPVDNGDQATALRVVVAGNANSSVNIMQVGGANVTLGQKTQANSIPVSLASDTSILGIQFYDGSFSQVGNQVVVAGAVESSIIYQARTTNPTAKADGADVRPKTDDLGRQLIRPVQVRDLMRTAYASITNGTETTLVTAAAGEYLDLVYILGANNSDVAVSVDIRAVSGGNIMTTLRIPPNATAGVSLPVPIPQDETGNAWTVDGPDETGRTITISALFSREV